MNEKPKYLNIDHITSLGRSVVFSKSRNDNLSTIYYRFCGVERMDISLYMKNIISIEAVSHSNCLKYIIKHEEGTDTIICDKLEIEEVKDLYKKEIARVATKTHEENTIKMLLIELEKKDPNNLIVNLIKGDFFPDSI